MKVKELVERLVRQDWDAEVFVFCTIPEEHEDVVELDIDDIGLPLPNDDRKWVSLICSE